jgi:hypothetical protein
MTKKKKGVGNGSSSERIAAGARVPSCPQGEVWPSCHRGLDFHRLFQLWLFFCWWLEA